MSKYIKLFEELNFAPQNIMYDLTDSNNVKSYQFVFMDYTFTVDFTRQVVDDTHEIYNYDELSEHDKVLLSGWRRDFYTEENGFSSLNQSTSSALKIYAYVTRITSLIHFILNFL